MLRWFAPVLAITVLTPGPGGVAAAGTSGRITGHGSGSGYAHSGYSGYRGAGTLRPGGGSLGTANTPRFGGRTGSGWHQPGWGGTRNPGWGYNFGPNLGGSGH